MVPPAGDARRLFGTDGIRGVANEYLTPELAYRLAMAASRAGDDPVLIGRDTRRSGPMLTAALQAGFNSAGVDTVDVGIVPAGAVSRLTRDTAAMFGIMVSASHNPGEDNGIKLFGRDGTKLSAERQSELESWYVDHRESRPRPVGPLVGVHTVMSEATDRYVDYLMSMRRYSLRGLSFVLDCAHGAAFAAAPRLFEAAGASIQVINAEPNGMNINLECGATDVRRLAKIADGRVGLAFDGDADRLIAVDEDGRTVNGDVILAIFVRHLLQRDLLKKNVVVTTEMANLGFHKAMQQMGVEVLQTAVGDRVIVERMRKSRAVLGGEQSGHIILEDRATGDGVRSAHRLAEVMAASGKELRELRTVMEEYPQVLINVPVGNRAALPRAAAVWQVVNDLEASLGKSGRVLVRASGTEQLVRVMVEAATNEAAAEAAARVAATVEETMGSTSGTA